MSQVNPPFRADHVGSLLRPAAVHEARAQRADGSITAARLREVEDAAIAEAVRRVEALGMRSVTDGEFRRAWFHLDFLQQLDGVAVTGNIAASSDAGEHRPHDATEAVGRRAAAPRRATSRSTTTATWPRSPPQTPKVCIPSPTMVHFRGGRAAIDIDAYPDLDEFFADLARVLPGRDRRPLRRRLPLRPARRHQPRLPVRPGHARRARSSAATIPTRCPTPTPS